MTWPDLEGPPGATRQRPHKIEGSLPFARKEKQRLTVQSRAARENRKAYEDSVRAATSPDVPLGFDFFLDWQRRTESKPETAWTVAQRDDAWRRHLHADWAEVPLDRVDRALVSEWVWRKYGELVGPNDEGYRGFEVAWKTLSEMLADACRFGHIEYNPASKKLLNFPPRRKLRTSQKPQKALTREQLRRVIDACRQRVPGHMARSPLSSQVLVGVSLEMLTRRGEVAALRARHFNLIDCYADIADNEVRVKGYRAVHLPKDRDERRPSISTSLRDMIVEHLTQLYGGNVPPDALLFPYGREHGGVMSPNAVGHWLNRISRRAQLTDIHTGKPLSVTLTLLRATGMSLVDASGVARSTIAAQAGHQDEKVQRRHYLQHLGDNAALKAYSAVYERLWADHVGAGPRLHVVGE